MERRLSESEIQVLIALIELSSPIETPHNTHYAFHPGTIEEAAAYFHQNLLPWDSAYGSLEEKQLIFSNNEGYRLTAEGFRQAKRLRQQRPPIYYWYRTLYRAIPSSLAFARFCEEVYGVNWEQHGFCDRQQIQLLLDALSLRAHQSILDIGCGTGRFTEYLSDSFDLQATGIDYCDAAIQLARDRTIAKRTRLTFDVRNIDSLSYSSRSFDAIVSIDSLGFVADMEHTIAKLYTMLKAGGRLAIFWFAIADKPDRNSAVLDPERNFVARAFQAHNIAYRVTDVSEENLKILQRKHTAALRYKDAFLTEGNQFLFKNLLMESEKGIAPFSEKTCRIRRFFYLAEKSGGASSSDGGHYR